MNSRRVEGNKPRHDDEPYGSDRNKSLSLFPLGEGSSR